jgi:hypothetical protein
MTADSQAKRQKHHYIPQFYLKNWATPEERGQDV